MTTTATTTTTTQKRHLRIVPHLDSSPNSLVFNIIERDLFQDTVLKIGRFTDRFYNLDRITFKSKVVSRGHAEIWVENDQFYIRDTKSSSGTFVNRARLSAPNQESKPYLLHHGDIVQLGVDYQGGHEEIYRCVKMRIEINQLSSLNQSNSSYCLNSFKSIRNLSQKQQDSDETPEVDECCICLYAIAPFQALFVAPCSHSFHFKCCYPLLNNYPGFTCPLCRSYSDLNANVAIETEEVIEMLKKNQPGSSSCSPPTETVIADFPISTTTALNKVHNGDNLQHVHIENLSISNNNNVD